MYGDDPFPDAVEGTSTPQASVGSDTSTPESKVVQTDKTTASGQKILTGSFKLKEWNETLHATRALDGNNMKGYPRTLLLVAIDKADQGLVKTKKNNCADAVPSQYHMKGADTFGTHASMKEMSYVREVGSKGHIRALTEGGGLSKAYPVC